MPAAAAVDQNRQRHFGAVRCNGYTGATARQCRHPQDHHFQHRRRGCYRGGHSRPWTHHADRERPVQCGQPDRGRGDRRSLYFDLGGFGNPSSAPLNVAGAFTANGTITINVAASVVAVGPIPLVQYGSRAGIATTVLGSLPAGVAAHLATSGNTLELVIDSAGVAALGRPGHGPMGPGHEPRLV